MFDVLCVAMVGGAERKVLPHAWLATDHYREGRKGIGIYSLPPYTPQIPCKTNESLDANSTHKVVSCRGFQADTAVHHKKQSVPKGCLCLIAPCQLASTTPVTVRCRAPWQTSGTVHRSSDKGSGPAAEELRRRWERVLYASTASVATK